MPAWAAAMGPAWATMEDIKAEWEWGVGLETWLPGADDNVALFDSHMLSSQGFRNRVPPR